jgi:hypothetical protein
MPSKMKTCEDYRIALTDAAAAAVQPSIELRAHLDACGSCREAFREELQLFAAMDSGLRVTANAEVPASLLPRVRAELNQRHVPQRSWVPAGAAMAAAVALVAVIVFVRGFGRDTVPTNPPLNSFANNISPAEIQRDPPVVAAIETTSPRAKNKTVRAAKTAPVAQAEGVAVVVPAGQKQAMDALLAGVRHGQVKADVLIAENSEKTLEDLQVSPLDISPIEMKPLADVVAASPASPNEKVRR